MLDGVVQQLGESVLGHAGHGIRQGQAGQEIPRPGQVLVQAGNRVAPHHLAQQARAEPHAARRDLGPQPLRGHQFAQQRPRHRLADPQPFAQRLAQ